MAIIIQNISKKFSERGMQDYVLRINKKEICRFKHKRSEGLQECLQEAIRAIKRKEIENISYLIQARILNKG